MFQREIEWRSPLAAFAPLAQNEGAALLHGGDAVETAQWSFIAAEPARRIECRKGETLLDGKPVPCSPFEALQALHAERRRSTGDDSAAPLASGVVGFAGYECGGFIEPSAAGPASPYAIPDFSFAAYDAIAAFDRTARRAFVSGRSPAAAERLEALLGAGDAGPVRSPSFAFKGSNFSREAYCAAVAAVVERIRDGELFQANISQRIEAAALAPLDPYALFKIASATSSAPFGAFLQHGASKILSLSPERFFAVRRIDGGRLAIVAEPIKGTRPRGATPEEDARLQAELAADPKDRAENVMIADLTRNDLSKICEDHSVREEAICEAVAHATVHHLVSRISGVLRRELDAADALAALFPCGSITGAPKAQAMTVIAEIERSGRGPYCGAIGYIDDRGGADLSVAIRLAIVEGERLFIPVGGGVTLRSDPQAEYDETLDKAQQFLRLIGLKDVGQA